MKSPVIVMLAAVLLAFGSAPSLAQTARPNSGGGASAQAMQQLQQLAAERTQLQAEMSRLKAELEAARKERDTLKKTQEGVVRRTRGAESELARVQADNARLEGEVAREKQRVEELVTRFREAAVTLREVETDRATRTQLLAQREQELKVCVDRNSKLYALNADVLAKFEDQGFWSSLARREPFTQLKRVELENLVDGYRGAADDNRLPAPASAKP
jgi:chromosome segregation ATPase